MHGVEATSGGSQTSLNKAEVDVIVADDPAVITSSISMTSSSTNADVWFYGLGYQPKTLNM